MPAEGGFLPIPRFEMQRTLCSGEFIGRDCQRAKNSNPIAMPLVFSNMGLRNNTYRGPRPAAITLQAMDRLSL